MIFWAIFYVLSVVSTGTLCYYVGWSTGFDSGFSRGLRNNMNGFGHEGKARAITRPRKKK